MLASNSHDPKRGEREYFAKVGPEGITHALAKPFSDDYCPQYLAVMTALFSLLPPPPLQLIEFGCGTGWLALYLARRGYTVTGIDISPDAVHHAAMAARDLPHAKFVTADYEGFDGGGVYDAALFHDSLHHAEDEKEALRSAWRALKPGGFVLTFEPGTGHHESEGSQRAIQEYGVHEKDMPPGHIVALGRAVGFARDLVLPHPYALNRLMYRRTYHQSPTQGDLRGRRFLGQMRAMRALFPSRHSGLVVLWK